MDIESQKYYKEWYEKHKKMSLCPCGCGKYRRVKIITVKYAHPTKCRYRMFKTHQLNRAVEKVIKERDGA